MLNAGQTLINAQRVLVGSKRWPRYCSESQALRRNVPCFGERQDSNSRPQEYIGSDGRRKATIEEAFSAQSSDISEPQGVAVQRVTAEKLEISEGELTEKLEALQQLLPNLLSKMAIMGPDTLSQLAADPAQLTQKLVTLKETFPEADTARMVYNELSLVLKADLQKIAAAADELRAILPNINVDKLVEDNPGVLNVESFKKTIQHAKDIMGQDLDVIDTLKRRPDMIFQFQQGKDLIPYDEVPTQKP